MPSTLVREVECPSCGHGFAPVERTGRARMVWSRRLDQYVRAFLTDAEYRVYDQRGSID